MRLSSTASAKAVMSYGISRIRDSSSLRIKLRLGGRLRSGMTKRERKNAGCRPCKSSSGIAVDVQQRLNCALPSFSLKLWFLSIPKSSRHIQELSIDQLLELAVDLFNRSPKCR